jgi:hypothetical protein
MDEEESLSVARQQSYVLQHFLDDLYRVWPDAASREIRGRFLEVQRREDEGMLRAFEVQHAFLGRMRKWLDVADMHMQKARQAQKDREQHIAYVQREIEEAERERGAALAGIKAAEELLPRVLRLIQAANAIEQ